MVDKGILFNFYTSPLPYYNVRNCMEHLRKESESDFDYILRLVEGKSNGIYDIDYVELFKLAFGVTLNSDECRKRYYGLKMLLP